YADASDRPADPAVEQPSDGPNRTRLGSYSLCVDRDRILLARLSAIEVHGVCSHVYERSRFARGADLHFLGIVYRVRITGGGLRDESDGTTDMAAWIARDQLPSLPLVDVPRFGREL